MVFGLKEKEQKSESKVLGRGLSALLSENNASSKTSEVEGRVVKIDFSNILVSKYQPRSVFDNEKIDELATSIKQNGVLQPVLVRKMASGSYEIVAGERRLRAAKKAGLRQIPAIVKDLSNSDAMEIALVENVQRQNLTPLEEAEGYKRLAREFGYKQEDISSVVGKSRSHIANMLRLLELPNTVKILVNQEKLSAGHARALLNSSQPEYHAQRIIRSSLNVRQAEEMVAKERERRGRRPALIDPDIKALQKVLSEKYNAKVLLRSKGGRGDVVIKYENLAHLDIILELLGRD